MKPLPLGDERAPIACTLAAAEVPARVALLERLRDAAVSVERTPHGLLLRFPPDPAVEADVRRFAVDEKRCCTFWDLAAEAGDDELELVWEGPDDAATILDRLHDLFTGEGELTEVEGLL